MHIIYILKTYESKAIESWPVAWKERSPDCSGSPGV